MIVDCTYLRNTTGLRVQSSQGVDTTGVFDKDFCISVNDLIQLTIFTVLTIFFKIIAENEKFVNMD